MLDVVEKLYPSILSAEDVLFIAGSVVPVISKQVVGDAGIEEMVESVNTSFDMLQAAVDRSRSNELTPLVEKMDRMRVLAHRCLKHYVTYWTLRSDEPEKAAAARKILRIIKQTTAGSARQGYEARSVRFPILIEKLELPENKEVLLLIDGESAFDFFKKADESFADTLRQRAENEAETDKVRKDEAKAKAVHYLGVLFTSIGYRKEQNGGTFDSLVEMLNDVITDTTAVARARKTRGENGKPEQNITPEQEVSAG